MNMNLFFSQVNSMTPVIKPIPKLSISRDFSFVASCFYKVGNNIKDSINEQTANINKKNTTFTR